MGITTQNARTLHWLMALLNSYAFDFLGVDPYGPGEIW
jgi:hypothetical protein